ncbi:hypothetical protein QQP08_019445 [Theobroma cacao]|nr:hypothetical protein QQP08_019445 [Theobroma cacao]
MVEKNAGALSFNVGTNGVLRKRKSRSESDGDLSDIDDAEQKQKKPTTGKKSTSAKKAVASRMEKRKEEGKENKKRLSSKINYDALEKLSDEPEEVAEKTKKNSIDSHWSNQIDTQQSRGTSGTSGLEICGFEEDIFSDEVEPENSNLYSYGDGEEDGYGYREDYDYEEF